VAAEPLGGLDILAGDSDGDAASADLGSQSRDVVGLVGTQLSRAVPGPAAPGPDWGEGVQQRHHDLRVVDVCGGDQDRERKPGAVAEDKDL